MRWPLSIAGSTVARSAQPPPRTPSPSLLPPSHPHHQGSSKGSGCLLVLDADRRLLGTLSDGDLRRALARTGEAALELTVLELMNFKKPFPRTVTAETMAFDALRRMEVGPPVTYIPVLRGDPAAGGDTHLEGLVTIHDMIAAGLM